MLYLCVIIFVDVGGVGFAKFVLGVRGGGVFDKGLLGLSPQVRILSLLKQVTALKTNQSKNTNNRHKNNNSVDNLIIFISKHISLSLLMD